MRIGMILAAKFPSDFRVEKEISSLKKKHEIFLLCHLRGDDHLNEKWKGINISRIFTGSERLWSNWQLFRGCYSNLWKRKIELFIDNNHIEILHVHDLPLIGTAIEVAKKYNIPVIADLHENFPELLALEKKESILSSPSFGTLIIRLLISIKHWKKYEREVVPKADAVITVIEEASQRLIDLNIPPSKLRVVANYNRLDESGDRANLSFQNSGKFNVVYAGGFGPSRDLKTLIRAAAAISTSDIPELAISMLGAKGRTYEIMKEYVDQLRVADKVSIYKWVPMDHVDKMMNEAHIGLVPHRKSEHTDATIPHKLFQYMAHGLPVIVSNCKPLERIVKESGAGLVYKTGDAEELASCLKVIYNNPMKAKEMANAGVRAVHKQYNWSFAEKVLLELYDELEQKNSYDVR